MEHPFLMFLDHTQRRSIVGRTPVDERSARRRDLYLTTHDTHNRQTSMPSVGFEPTISAGERPQTYPLDRATTGTGTIHAIPFYIFTPVYFNRTVLVFDVVYFHHHHHHHNHHHHHVQEGLGLIPVP